MVEINEVEMRFQIISAFQLSLLTLAGPLHSISFRLTSLAGEVHTHEKGLSLSYGSLSYLYYF